MVRMLRPYGGICIWRGQEVKWVTPLTAINHHECAYPERENKGALGMAYGDVCLLVRIGEAGERLAYLTAVEVRKESAKVHCHFY